MTGHGSPLGAVAGATGRLVYLVRHGQYFDDGPNQGCLTPLGRKQTVHLARYLAALDIDRLQSSDWPRAIETADLLSKHLGLGEVKRHRVLREVLPVGLKGMRVPRKARKEGKQRIEEVMHQFFRPSKKPRREVLVCHGNLIRCLVCTLLGAPLSAFPRLLTHHVGLTCIFVSGNGPRVVSFNSVGHLPPNLQTLS